MDYATGDRSVQGVFNHTFLVLLALGPRILFTCIGTFAVGYDFEALQRRNLQG